MRRVPLADDLFGHASATIGAPPARSEMSMSARHRLTELPAEQYRSGQRAPRTTSLLARTSCYVFGSLIVAAVMAALMVNAFGAGEKVDGTAARAERPPQASQPVRQEGTVIAVSTASVTARSADGYTQTYVLTPDTTVITRAGSQSHSASVHFIVNDQFAVNDEVTILGTVQNGQVLATAVAHRVAAHGGAPPMDYVETGR